MVVTVMRAGQPMTVTEIVRAIRRRFDVKIHAGSVRTVLASSRSFAHTRPRFAFLQRSTLWKLVEAGPSADPGTSGAPVPARPHRPTLSGAAAAELTFREEEPPTDGIGRIQV